MKNNNKKKSIFSKETGINSEYNNFKKLIVSLLFIIGTIAGLYAIITFILDAIAENNKVFITGTVTEVKYEDKNTIIKVDYEVQRVKYYQQIKTKENLTVNDQYEITYNKNNPSLPVNNEHSIEIAVGASILAIIYALTINDMIIIILKNKRINKFKTEGILIKANIQEILINTKAIRFKGRRPYIIRLSYVNPQNGKTYIYKSENIYEDIKSTIERNNIQTVDVYLNKDNTDKYYIDLNSIFRIGD